MAHSGDGRADIPGTGASTGTQLDHYPADLGGGPGGAGGSGKTDLASSPAEKRTAANSIEQNIEPGSRKAGDAAEDQTNAVVKAFDAKDGHGWVTSGAVSKAYKAWGEQVKTLMNRLSSEKAALRGTNTVLSGTDHGVEAGLRSVSALDAY
ncbi:hypothetical protein [Streptomyces echinatus]|uniref:Uncharacterized protein n=1 Tax=Streptomyces echinatus TaxID=67293 RepID=A0A7W9PSW9_9ACTN|nr:hypothetical protein [Streptomyces echinatus]MBB5927281.1 hypothetical protein [Streptomyces echinatus]